MWDRRNNLLMPDLWLLFSSPLTTYLKHNATMNVRLGNGDYVDTRSTVSSSTERSIMCDKILSPDTLYVDMGDFVWNNTASCKCRIWNEVQLISVCCPSLHFWLVINKIFWSWNWRAPIWWAVCCQIYSYIFYFYFPVYMCVHTAT